MFQESNIGGYLKSVGKMKGFGGEVI